MAFFMHVRMKQSKVSSISLLQIYRHIYKYIRTTIEFERGNIIVIVDYFFYFDIYFGRNFPLAHSLSRA
jgi:hypothetical protein